MNKETILELACELLNKDKKCECPEEVRGIKIVVLQRGWVVIGNYTEDGEYGILNDAYVIRRWGTSEGLGQLALQGKQGDTVLEKTGVVRFLKVTSVMLIDVDQSK